MRRTAGSAVPRCRSPVAPSLSATSATAAALSLADDAVAAATSAAAN